MSSLKTFPAKLSLGLPSSRTDRKSMKELTKLVGSLAEGLLVLVCSLPKRAHGEVGHARSHKKTIFKGSKYSKELLTAVRELRQEKV